MHKGLKEKLFFMERLDVTGFRTVIDFGCGAGEILHAVAEADPLSQIRLIGIDRDEYMRDLTLKGTPGIEVYPSLEREMVDDRTLIIFSSVLHEVGDRWPEIRRAISGTGATVAVRDMCFGVDESKAGDIRKWRLRDSLSKVVRHSNPGMLADFIGKYGMMTDIQLCHYLLKYTYVDNWALELEENYFSFDYGNLADMGETLYQRQYLLDHVGECVKRDFGIDMIYTTHVQMIVRLRKD